MKCFILVTAGIEDVAIIELLELVGKNGKKVGSGILEADLNPEEILNLCSYSQSFRRILVAVSQNTDLKKINFSQLIYPHFFSDKSTFKFEIEGIKGNENRLNLCRQLATELIAITKKSSHLNLTVDLKKPDVLFLLFFTDNIFFLGIDCCGLELDKRPYRLFPHKASFRGDLAYFFLRKSGWNKKDSLVIGFIKDGVLPIEAALFFSGKKINSGPFLCSNFPIFQNITPAITPEKTDLFSSIVAFDDNLMNIRATQKNLQLAGVTKLVKVHKLTLEDLGLEFSSNSINHLILYITKKDEDAINEIYLQVHLTLRKKGTLLLIGRQQWDMPISTKFNLSFNGIIHKGESNLKYWVLEKK